MMELNKIQSTWNWGEASSFLNSNFEKIRIELMKIRYASILTFCKGYFSTEAKLLAKFPQPSKEGEYAFVGIPWPGTVYEADNGVWKNTGKAPELGESAFVEMLKRHIDDSTILWNESKNYIYAVGGITPPPVPSDTFTISAGINPSNIGQCEVTATGDVVKTESAADKSNFTITARKGGIVTVKITPKAGYQIQKLNVDTVSQGTADSHTFTDVQQDHTMYIWMEVAAQENPTDFLLRSDKPDVFYSSTHVALSAIKADYPNGLTQDVTLSCVKPAKERRLSNDENKPKNETTFLAVLKEFNQGSLYTLTIDGANQLTYDCASLGGLQFKAVDNVILRNTSFINFANYIDGSTPDEIAAVMLIGSDTLYARNLAIWDCSFNGISTTNKSTCSTYTLSTKYTENISVQGSVFTNNAGLTFNMSNARLCSFIKNNISGSFRYGAVAHAGLFNITNSHKLILEDNDIDGSTFIESLLYLMSINNIYLRRNRIRGGARVIEMASNTAINRLVIESNQMVGCLVKPIFGWISEYFSSASDISDFSFKNNTLWMSGDNWQQFVCRFSMADTRRAYIFDNIVIDPDGNMSSGIVKFMQFKTLGELHSGGNMFKVSIKDADKGQTYGSIIAVINETNSPDSITISGSDSYKLSYLQTAGYDVGSVLVSKSEKLLDIEAGGSTYAITPSFNDRYPAIGDVPKLDLLYQGKTNDHNSRGCYNLNGLAIAETSEVQGYTGEDYDSSNTFGSSEQYAALGESVLSLSHNTLNRSRLVRWLIEGPQHKSLALGKHALVSALPVMDENEEYLEDELYTVKID